VKYRFQAFAFKCNLYRYSPGGDSDGGDDGDVATLAWVKPLSRGGGGENGDGDGDNGDGDGDGSSSWGRFVGADEVRVLMDALDVRGVREAALHANLEALLPTIAAAEAAALGRLVDSGDKTKTKGKKGGGGGAGAGGGAAAVASSSRRSARQPTTTITDDGGDGGSSVPSWMRGVGGGMGGGFGAIGGGAPKNSEEEAALLAGKLLKTLVGRAGLALFTTLLLCVKVHSIDDSGYVRYNQSGDTRE
jgi:hypothetical protein